MVVAGPIWMDNVMCNRNHEILDQCDFSGWGVHNCRHSDDYSVICLPSELGVVMWVRVMWVRAMWVRVVYVGEGNVGEGKVGEAMWVRAT
jgi:hypothetical protein